jgi:hypothetical protein
VVLEETFNGMLRLSRAACPEDHLLVSVSEVQHLSVWLMAQLGHVERGAAIKAPRFAERVAGGHAVKEDPR